MSKPRKPREPADVKRERAQREARQRRERDDNRIRKNLNDRLNELESESERK